MHPAGLVALPPGPGPHHPLPPREAIAHVLPVVRYEPLRVAEIRKVVARPPAGYPMTVGRDADDVIGWLVPRHAGGDLCHLLRLERGLAALLVGHLQGGEDLPLAHAAPAHRPRQAGQYVVAAARRYALPDGCGRPLRTLLLQKAHKPLRRVCELRLLRREDPLVGLAVRAHRRRRHDVAARGLHVEARRHTDTGPNVVLWVPEVEVHAAAGGPHHRGCGVAVLLQPGFALGAVHVEDQDARDGPCDDADARPRPGAELLLRGLARKVRTQFAEVRLFRARLDRYGRPSQPAVLYSFSPGRGAHVMRSGCSSCTINSTS